MFSDVLPCPDFTALKKELLQLQGWFHSMKLLGESVVPLFCITACTELYSGGHF